MSSRGLHIPFEASQWAVVRDWSRLDDLCLGIWDCPHSTPKLADNGPLVVRSQDIRTGVFRTEEAARVTEETYNERIARAEPRPGDLLYSREGTYFGIAAEMPSSERVCLGQRMVLIRPDPSTLDNRFLRMWLNSPVLARHIHGFRDGTVAERLNMPTIRALPVPKFMNYEQGRIAELLGRLDDTIELNGRMNKTLETIPRAIFKDWFVDFGPTRAKAGGRAPYLAPELWDLFPDALDDEDKPVGWRHWTLGDLASNHRATVTPAACPERQFEHYSIPAYDAGQEPALDAGASIKSNKTTVPADAVLLSKLNPNIPRVWIPNPPNDRPQVASTEFLPFTAKPPANGSVLFCLFREAEFRREMEALVTGTSKSHQRVSPKALVQRQVLHGVASMFEQFDKQASPLLSRVLKNRAESRTLAETRDLPFRS